MSRRNGQLLPAAATAVSLEVPPLPPKVLYMYNMYMCMPQWKGNVGMGKLYADEYHGTVVSMSVDSSEMPARYDRLATLLAVPQCGQATAEAPCGTPKTLLQL